MTSLALQGGVAHTGSHVHEGAVEYVNVMLSPGSNRTVNGGIAAAVEELHTI